MKKLHYLFLFLLCSCFAACIDDEEQPAAPKPRGYFRIDLPEKNYKRFDTAACPYSFEYPKYGGLIRPQQGYAEPCWYNLEIPGFNATIHLSYKEVHNNIDTLIDNAWELTEKHASVAAGYRDSAIIRPDADVYGLVFELKGDAASQLQFYLTDSTKHFLRGALYFFAAPNKDSIAPVLNFLKQDVYHLIETFRWKDGGQAAAGSYTVTVTERNGQYSAEAGARKTSPARKP